jgi:SAM-dependent methyltransferase
MTFPPIGVKTAEDRNWWFAARTRALLGILDREVAAASPDLFGGGGTPVSLILDVGCGAGNMHHHLVRYGHVRGVDSFFRPLRVARQRGHLVSQAEGSAISFPDASFELVTALDVIEHCQDDAAVLSECARVLRPGGLLAITVPAFPWLWSDNDAINGHKRRYRPVELDGKLKAAGFAVRRLTCNNLAVLPMAAALIFLRQLRGGKLGLSAPSTDDDAYQVEMQSVHPALNAALTALGMAEAWVLQRASFPAGTGIIAVAQKPILHGEAGRMVAKGFPAVSA